MKIPGLILLSVLSFNLFASDVTIKSAELINTKSTESVLSIKHLGTVNDNPLIQIQDKNLKVTIPNSGLAGKINKKVNGTSISASMTDSETVSLNLMLPYSLAGKESDVTITLKEGMINVHYPRLENTKKAVAKEISRSPSVNEQAVIIETAANNIEAEKLDENYLTTLVKNQEKLAEAKHPEAKAEAKKDLETKKQVDTDRVNLTQAGVAKNVTQTKTSEEGLNKTESEGQSRFSVTGYIGKFVAFLSLMIAGFYGVLTLFKKGIIKKGKLGFLNSTKLVEVLSTTHIAPKRSLIMVKAHKQVFLISSSETGVQFLSEINDVNGLIKTGEEEVTGFNFDTNLNTANKSDKQFRLKEEVRSNYDTDYVMDSLDDMLNNDVPAKSTTNAAKAIEKNPVKDQVKFSDQIKTKVKNLKQL
ncbi:MAG: flagellar biosynthetic protein FliO [Bacteriovoracaceae bacterium]|nr:flagellar biosynthetic protein FliO [Bacteriovoracaceae bacterium]